MKKTRLEPELYACQDCETLFKVKPDKCYVCDLIKKVREHEKRPLDRVSHLQGELAFALSRVDRLEEENKKLRLDLLDATEGIAELMEFS